jgi:hypothetical protein
LKSTSSSAKRSQECLLFLLTLLCLPSWGQTGKVESIPALDDPAIPASIRQSLAPTGYRITLDANTSAIDLWFCKQAATLPKGTPSDGVYDLVESALVGVLHFSRAASDYRGQAVPAGFYTLRYELMPNDGNHLGVAPSRDFLLLVPASSDPGPEKALHFQELVSLSRLASGTKHPAPLSLVAPGGGSAKASLAANDEGQTIFWATIHLSSGADTPVGVVVKGTAPQ